MTGCFARTFSCCSKAGQQTLTLCWRPRFLEHARVGSRKTRLSMRLLTCIWMQQYFGKKNTTEMLSKCCHFKQIRTGFVQGVESDRLLHPLFHRLCLLNLLPSFCCPLLLCSKWKLRTESLIIHSELGCDVRERHSDSLLNKKLYVTKNKMSGCVMMTFFELVMI